MTPDPFEAERPYLTRLAYRMLGSSSDAEDMVQETWLRWERSGRPPLAQPRAWFTRACTRLCLDRLKSARHTRETYVGQWLPEPLLVDEGAEARRELDETLSMALLVTLEQLKPAERAAFLLHDVFDYEFTQVAEILERTPASCRQLAVRARRRVRTERPGRSTSREELERLQRAFFGALGAGDFDGLRGVLAEDVVVRSDGGGKALAAALPIVGATKAATFFIRTTRESRLSGPPDLREVWFNGAPGVVLYLRGRPVTAFHFLVHDELIAGIFAQRNPDKLAAFLPA